MLIINLGILIFLFCFGGLVMDKKNSSGVAIIIGIVVGLVVGIFIVPAIGKMLITKDESTAVLNPITADTQYTETNVYVEEDSTPVSKVTSSSLSELQSELQSDITGDTDTYTEIHSEVTSDDDVFGYEDDMMEATIEDFMSDPDKYRGTSYHMENLDVYEDLVYVWKSTLYPDTDPDDDETLDLPTYRCYIDNLPDGYNQIIIVDVDNVLEDRLLEGDFVTSIDGELMSIDTVYNFPVFKIISIEK